MNNLNKMEVFRECGFLGLPDMPSINFIGYDKVMDHCYIEGRKDINRIHITQDEGGIKNLLDTWELVKKIKDLETENARLFERNHELQVDNEDSLKEVEKQYKIVAELRKSSVEHARDRLALVEMSIDLSKQSETIEEYKTAILELVEQEGKNIKTIEELRNHNGDLARAGLNSPKSKFVITVEEF